MIVDEQIKSNQKPTRVEDDVGLLLLQYIVLYFLLHPQKKFRSRCFCPPVLPCLPLPNEKDVALRHREKRKST